jgi:hypothetical protein
VIGGSAELSCLLDKLAKVKLKLVRKLLRAGLVLTRIDGASK